MKKSYIYLLLLLIISPAANAEDFLTEQIGSQSKITINVNGINPNQNDRLLDFESNHPCTIELIKSFQEKVIRNYKVVNLIQDFEIKLSKLLGFPLGTDKIPGLNRNELNLKLSANILRGYAKRNIFEYIDNWTLDMLNTNRSALKMSIVIAIPGSGLKDSVLFEKSIRVKKLKRLKERDRCPKWKIDTRDLNSYFDEFTKQVKTLKNIGL